MIAGLLLAAFLAVPTFQELVHLYDYDPNTRLELKTEWVSDHDGIEVRKLEFASPKGGTTTGYVVTPPGKGPGFAGIVWMHSGGALQWLPDAKLMAAAGAVSVIIDSTPPAAETPEAFRDSMIRAVVDMRRAADILIARPHVDPKKLAIVGHSFGAMMAAVAASVDRRFRAAVFEVGLQGMGHHIATSPHPWAVGVRKGLGDGLPHFLEVVEPIEAIHYVPHLAPVSALFQSARFDPGVPAGDAQAFYDAATQPKRIRWYDTGHDITDIAAIADRARFLGGELKLLGIDAVIRAKAGKN